MTDFNAQAQTEDQAAVAPAAAPAEAKVFNPESVKTKKHAAHLRKLAETRLEKQRAEVRATKDHIEVLKGLEETLPEGTTPSAAPKIIKAVGDVVTFNYGREAKRTQKTGVVAGVRIDEATGHPTQYRVVVGEGFDEESFRIFPGQIVGNEPDTEDGGDLFDNPADSDGLETV